MLLRPVRLNGVTTQDHNLNTHRCGNVYKAVYLYSLCCASVGKITALNAAASVYTQRVSKAMHYCSTYGPHDALRLHTPRSRTAHAPRHSREVNCADSWFLVIFLRFCKQIQDIKPT